MQQLPAIEQKFVHARRVQDAGNLHEAEDLYRQIIAVHPDHQDAIDYCGTVLLNQGKLEEALYYFQKLLSLNESSWVHSNLAITLDYMGRFDEALIHIRRMMALHPDPQIGSLEAAHLLLRNGHVAEGFDLMARVFNRAYPLPWTGQLLQGETVLVHAETVGLGDAIQCARYLPLIAARGGRVVVCAQEPLRRLLETIPGVAEVFSEQQPPCLPLQYYRAPVFALPAAFGAIPRNVPYLKGDARPWAEFVAGLPGLRIGLRWAGSRGTSEDYSQMDNHRSMRLADLSQLLSVPGCSFVSLQLEEAAGQLRDLPPGLVHDVSHRLNDFTDTAGLIAALDLVISVDTSVAHLAGALGKPVWMLNKFFTDSRWIRNRQDTYWYPTMRVFHQPTPGDWNSVISDVANNLIEVTYRPRFGNAIQDRQTIVL